MLLHAVRNHLVDVDWGILVGSMALDLLEIGHLFGDMVLLHALGNHLLDVRPSGGGSRSAKEVGHLSSGCQRRQSALNGLVVSDSDISHVGSKMDTSFLNLIVVHDLGFNHLLHRLRGWQVLGMVNLSDRISAQSRSIHIAEIGQVVKLLG